MENIPAGYLIFVYFIIALPYIVAILGAIALLAILLLYFTNRRKTASKILKIFGITMAALIVFILLTKSSPGI